MSATIATPNSPAGAGSSPSPLFGVWQPIASVPKDGTWILVTCGGIYVPSVAYWNKEVEMWENDEGEQIAESKWKLSHWMPLPAPPKVNGSSHTGCLSLLR